MFKESLKLTSGKIASKLIVMFSLPIIANIYTISDLGKYQLLLTIISTLGMISSLRYNKAIVTSKSDSEASIIFQSSILILILFSLLTYCLLYFFQLELLSFLGVVENINLTLHVPIGIFFFGFVEIIRHQLIRKKEFTYYAFLQICNNGLSYTLAIFLGYFYQDFLVLFGSYLTGLLLIIILFSTNAFLIIKKVSWEDFKDKLSEYKKLPLIESLSTFLNHLFLSLPIFILSRNFSSVEVGLYMVAYKTSSVPVSFLTTSFEKVFFQNISEKYNENSEGLLSETNKIVKKLVLIGLVPLLFSILLLPMIIVILFGEEYFLSGKIAQIISFGIYAQFCVAPLIVITTVTKNQEINLILVIAALFFSVSAMMHFENNLTNVILSYSVIKVLYYSVFYFFIRQSLKH